MLRAQWEDLPNIPSLPQRSRENHLPIPLPPRRERFFAGRLPLFVEKSLRLDSVPILSQRFSGKSQSQSQPWLWTTLKSNYFHTLTLPQCWTLDTPLLTSIISQSQINVKYRTCHLTATLSALDPPLLTNIISQAEINLKYRTCHHLSLLQHSLLWIHHCWPASFPNHKSMLNIRHVTTSPYCNTLC